MLKEALYYGRMAWYFGRYVKMPRIREPEALLRETLLHREENFLKLVQRGIFENPRSPYYHLFQLAQCTWQDLGDSVRRHGLEKTLENLREAGVYLTHEEVKGKTVRRHGREIPNDTAATANPAAAGGIETVSGGSRSAGLVTSSSNQYRHYRERYEILARELLVTRDMACGILRPILPSPNALIAMVGFWNWGLPPERWYVVGKSRSNGAYALATRLLVAEARLLGRRLPFPRFPKQDDFKPVAEWIAENKRNGRVTCIRSGVSAATRVCAAAMEANLDISCTVFLTSGEAISPARRRVLEAARVKSQSRYVISEIGTIGFGCRELTGNSVHLCADSVAVIVHRRPAPYVDAEVNSLLFTAVNPFASRLLINAEMEDAATLVPATCDCVFSKIGFHTVLKDVYSFGKLSGHGMTLGGDALLEIIEEQLPARFGGHPGDYQLVETEGAAQLELRLRVSPRVGPADTGEVQTYFLQQVGRLYGGALSARTWEAASSIRIEIAEPHKTRTGKVHALHLTAFGGGASGGEAA